ncbi:hypothetical protein [Persicitalea sp.]|uniref:hypothetical protein n=1 Tax=Persicitalea sp. TaxID=3100273 RepID=UPI003593DA83
MENKHTDQELQDLYENDPQAFAELARTDEDARVYALLFATFPRLDAVEIPADLGDRVIAQLEVKEAESRKWQNLFLAGAIGLTVIVGLVMSWILSPEMAKSFQAFSSYLPFITAAVLVFFGMELLDQKVVWGKSDELMLE